MEVLPLDDFCLAIKSSFASLNIPFDDEEMSFLLHFCHAQRVLGVSLWIPHSMTLHDLFLKNQSTLFFGSGAASSEPSESSSSHENTEPVRTCYLPTHRETQTSPICCASPVKRREESPEICLSSMTPAVKRRNSHSSERICSPPLQKTFSPEKFCSPPPKEECKKCLNCKCQAIPSPTSAVMVFNIQEWHSSGPIGRL